jgi:hypothetical protein
VLEHREVSVTRIKWSMDNATRLWIRCVTVMADGIPDLAVKNPNFKHKQHEYSSTENRKINHKLTKGIT